MRECFTPVESNEENRRGHRHFCALAQARNAAAEDRNLWEAFLHVITTISDREEIWILLSFSIFIVKNIGNICESIKSSSTGAFFLKAETRLNASNRYSSLLSASHARLGGYNIWETLESFSRLGRFLNESPAAASPSNCNMCLHTVILMKGNDGVHFNDVEFKDCLLFQRKAIFFHGNMSLSPLSFFFSPCNFILRNRHRRLNVLYRLSKYEREFRMWSRYIDNVPVCSYHCFDNASSQLFLSFLSFWVIMQNRSPNYHRHRSHSV